MKTWIVVIALVLASVVGGSAQGGQAQPEITSYDGTIFVGGVGNNPYKFDLSVNDMKLLERIQADCDRENSDKNAHIIRHKICK